MVRFLVVVACVAFGIARLSMPVVSEIHHDDIFKDAAHLFVGGLFGACGMAYSVRHLLKFSPVDTWLAVVILKTARLYLCLAVGMTILEVVAFVIHKA